MAPRGSIAIQADLRYDLLSYIDGRKVPSNLFLDIADKIAPPVPVDVDNGHIPEIFAGEGERIVDGSRNEEGSYPLVTWQISDKTFKTQAYGWEIAIDKFSGKFWKKLLKQEQINAEILQDIYKLGKNYRVFQKALDYASFGANNKLEITAALDNWLTGSNFRDDVDNVIAPRFFSTLGAEKEQISAILPITFLRKVIYIDDIREQLKFTSPIDRLNLQQRLDVIADYIGIKEVIPASGRYNTTHFNSVSGPTFSRLWDQDYAVFGILSSGGGWDKSFLRQPSYTEETEGRDYILESYDLPVNDQTRLRLKHYSGESVNYECGFIIKDIVYT